MTKETNKVKKMKKKYGCLIILVIGLFILFINHYYWSYSRRIGETNFYLVETMADTKEGKPLAGLYYKPTAFSAYCGENIPGFPKTILWNTKYLISKNFNGKNSNIIQYVVINMDSITPSNGEMRDIHIFTNEKQYYDYLKQIQLLESNMQQTDNHIAWWECIFK